MICCLKGPPIVRLTWDQAGAIATALRCERPSLDPFTLSAAALASWVASLPGFDDDPAAASPATIEAIRSAWRTLPR